MTKMLPPCDHDECGLTRCEREAKPPFAEARGSLSGSSVKKLLSEWERLAGEWRESEEQWRRNMDDQDTHDAVRMNCCRVRAKTLEDVIERVRAELAATSERQPTGNNAICQPDALK